MHLERRWSQIEARSWASHALDNEGIDQIYWAFDTVNEHSDVTWREGVELGTLDGDLGAALHTAVSWQDIGHI